MSYQEFIKPELLALVPVLNLIGLFLKRSKFKNKFIPLILGGIGIVISGAIVLTTEPLDGAAAIITAVITSLTQGILVAGAAVYGNQIVKQAVKGETFNDNDE